MQINSLIDYHNSYKANGKKKYLKYKKEITIQRTH